MDDTAINLENILEQSRSWAFVGDFTLLQWLKQISQDLEIRATKTTEALCKLDNNVRSANIALDNVANSLTTLQFGNQFVESRVQDDDEPLNANKAIKDTKGTEQNCTSKEMLSIFLDNNLKVLGNCHEKYSIDLEDSDDDEYSKEKTCIYQPINPYNERPLPFIFGSKDWHSKWHVGLCENQQENSYSGDEISEGFSQSSSTSHLDDDESFESNTEWVSSNSIDNDHLNLNIEVKNASSLRGSQPLYPITPVLVNVAKAKTIVSESSSVSTASSSLAKKSLQTVKQNEKLAQRSENINSINSKQQAKTSSWPIDNTSEYKTQHQKLLNLLAEPTESLESLSFLVSSAQNIIDAPHDKNIIKERSSASRTQPPLFVHPFDKSPGDDVPSTKSSMSSGHNIRRKTVNLFDEEEDMSKHDLLPVFTKNDELEKPIITNTSSKSITTNKSEIVSKLSKSLFDESDEDDDFLRAFVGKSSPKTATKTLESHKEFHEPTINSSLLQTERYNANRTSDMKANFRKRHSSKKLQNLFDTECNENDLRLNKTSKDENPKSFASDSKLLYKPTAEENIKKSVHLFNAFDNVPKGNNFNSDKIINKTNLFDDLDDVDDFFSTKPKDKNEIFQQTSINEKEKNSTSKNEERSAENVRDITIIKDDHSKTLTTKQLANTSKLQDNNISNEMNNKSKESALKGDQIGVTEIIENKVNTEPFRVQNELPAEEKRFKNLNLGNYTESHKDSYKNISAAIKNIALATENTIQKPSASNKYEFSSILFLDEPPEDDREFFETLSKTQNALNSNYISTDLENDMYEPDLPKVPATSTSNNQTDTSESFYTGLQLFSDIPPDDDAADNHTLNISPDDNQTKRLHSIFYDDFNETLMALNQKHTEKEILNHSILSDEPPPIIEKLNSPTGDITDHKVPDNVQEENYPDHKSKIFDSAAKFKEDINEFSNKLRVSKLQMPHINIDVQALLPGANILRKAKDDNTKPNAVSSYSCDIKPGPNVSKGVATEEHISKIHTINILRTAETEHILPNLTKNRVKASAARRPSTRRARQENYRKSLFEQQQILESSDETIEIQKDSNNKINKTLQTQKEANIPQTSPMLVNSNSAVKVQKQKLKDTITDALKTNKFTYETTIAPTSSLKYPESSSLIQAIENSADSLEFIKNVGDGSSNNVKQIKNINESNEKNEVKNKSKQEKGSFFFEDVEEDDDFLKRIKTNIVSKPKGKNATAKSALENSEANASSLSDLNINDINVETVKEIRALSSLKTETSSQEYEQQQPSTDAETANKLTTNKSTTFLYEKDDDDDLFKTTLQQSISFTTSSKKENRTNRAKSQFKSFLDSESDEEPILAGLLPTTATYSATIPSTKTNILPENTTLFMASESDSDDLLGKGVSTKTSNNRISTESISKIHTKAQPQSSLFGDDSDNDEFLTPSGNVRKNSVFKVGVKKNVVKRTTKTSTSLFSDLDTDEDDLFGGGPIRTKTANVTSILNVNAPSKANTTVSVAEISKLKTVDDNPLADLL